MVDRLVFAFMQRLQTLIGVAPARMGVLVFGKVAPRRGFGSGITASESPSRYRLMGLAFSGAVIAPREHRAARRPCSFMPKSWRNS